MRADARRFAAPDAAHWRRLDLNIARTENLLQQIWRYEPNWRPRTESFIAPGSVEGAISDSEARAEEAEAHLQRVRSGNFVSPLESQALPTRAVDGQAWINAYRVINNAPDLFGNPTWPYEDDTVAVANIDGRITVGVNSGAPTYTSVDDAAARQMRGDLINAYPLFMNEDSLGGKPNDSLFHAEATILLRAAHENGGALRDKIIIIYVDRPVCAGCTTVLPLLARELGSPKVMIIDNVGEKFIIAD